MSPVKELISYAGEFADRCKSSRWLGALFHVGVVVDIAADVEAHEAEQGRKAYANECTQRILAEKLRAILADKRVDASELTDLEKIEAQITACAEQAHDIAEALTA